MRKSSKLFILTALVAVFSVASVPFGYALHAIAHYQNPSDNHSHDDLEFDAHAHSSVPSVNDPSSVALSDQAGDAHHRIGLSCAISLPSNFMWDAHPSLIKTEWLARLLNNPDLRFNSRRIIRQKDPPIQIAEAFSSSLANKAPPA